LAFLDLIHLGSKKLIGVPGGKSVKGMLAVQTYIPGTAGVE